ncbi:MAG: nucleotidyl transferase AbiEii/AbiGii toxin family protein [Nitrospirae bacterium]|nr:nucleotidyl transferase AbiEii/AbiGii toxin family protein [Nitrospirota bacterium]
MRISRSQSRSVSVLSEDNPYRPQVALLLDVLPFVAQERCYALKGGTAINLFVRDLPRLSIDIDLTYLPVQDRATSLAALGAALERMASSIERQVKGIRVERTTAEARVFKLVAWRGRVRVTIEVSPVLRGCVRAPSVRGVSPAVEREFGYIEAPVVHVDDLYAGKLCAALDRQHPRDLFDVQLLLKHEGLNDALLDVFIVYLLSGDRPLAELLSPNLQPLEPTYEEQFRGMTLMLVTVQELEETRITMISLIRSRLTERQKEFLLSFKGGEPDWDLLNLTGVAELPAVQWKLQNVRRMGPAKRGHAHERLRKVLYG